MEIKYDDDLLIDKKHLQNIKTKLDRTTKHIANALTVAHVKVTSLKTCIKP